MNFFCTEKHANEWFGNVASNKKDMYVLDIEKANMVAKAIFGKERVYLEIKSGIQCLLPGAVLGTLGILRSSLQVRQIKRYLKPILQTNNND